MIGRESQQANNLFFTCSLIEYIARKTKNKRSDTVEALGRAAIEKIFDLADIYHSDNIETVSDDFIAKSGITVGFYDNVSATKYAVPSYWDIGKVYKRLILGITAKKIYPSWMLYLKLIIPLLVKKLMITTAVFTMKPLKTFLTLF